MKNDRGTLVQGLAVALVAASCSCAASSPHTRSDTREATVVAIGPTDFDSEMGFRLSIPNGFKVSVVNGPDFYVYFVSAGDQTVLGFYVGNYSQLPRKCNAAIQTAIGSMSGQCIASVDKAGASSRECLVHLRRDFPEQIHFWYQHLPEPARRVTDGILNTLTSTDGS